MARVLRLAALLCLAFVACSGDGYSIVIRFSPLDAAELVDRVDVAFINDCESSPTLTAPIEDAVLSLVVSRSGAAQELGELPEGQYGLYGRATNDCGLSAMGCDDIEILSSGGELLLELVVTDFGTCQPCEGPDCPCEGDQDCTPPEVCVDGQCVCEGDCPCVEDRDCPRNMTCDAGECVCQEWYLDCDGFEDNGCERLGTSCTQGDVNCLDSFDCYLECNDDSECMIGCYGQSCNFLQLYDLTSCNHDHCEASCTSAPMSSSCRSCLSTHCSSDLAACEDASC